MNKSYLVNSPSGEFENSMQRVYAKSEETDFTGDGQRFYYISGTRVTVTSWNSPKAGTDIPKGHACIDIENNPETIRREIEKDTEHRLEDFVV